MNLDLDTDYLLRSLPMGVICTKPSGEIIFANPAFADLLGYRPEEIMSIGAIEFYVKPQARDAWIHQMERNKTHRTWLLWKKKNQEPIWVRTDTTCVILSGQGRCYLGIAEPATPPFFEAFPRDRMWRESEILGGGLDRVLDALPFSVALKDINGIVIYGNNHYCANEANCDRSELKDKKLNDQMLYPPELAARYRQDDAVVLATGSVLDYTEPHVRVSGNGFPNNVHVVKMPVWSDSEEICGVLFFFWEETDEFLDLREIVRVSEESDIAQHTFPIVYEHDMAGDFTRLNRAGEILTGYSEEAFSKLNIVDIVTREYLPRVQRMLGNKQSPKNSPITQYTLEIEHAKTKAPIPLEVLTCRVGDNGMPFVRGHARDLRRDMLSIESNRHAIGNFLAQLLHAVERELPRDSPEQVRAYSRALGQRIKAMKLVSDESVDLGGSGLVEVNGRLQGFIERLGDIYLFQDSQIRIKCECDANLTMHAEQLKTCYQIVYELVLNSIKHAFPGGGAGLIQVEMRQDTEREASLVVADNGVGMPKFPKRLHGIRLVEDLVAMELKGSLHDESDLREPASGVRVAVRFPLKSSDNQ